MKRKLFIGLFVVVYTFCGWFYVLHKIRSNMLRHVANDERYVREIVNECGGADIVLVSLQKILDEFPKNSTHLYYDVSETDPRIPARFRKGGGTCVYGTNMVSIYFDAYGNAEGRRAGLLAFRKGAEEYGNSMITNGLWFWNGYPTDATRKAYYKEMERARLEIRKSAKKMNLRTL